MLMVKINKKFKTTIFNLTFFRQYPSKGDSTNESNIDHDKSGDEEPKPTKDTSEGSPESEFPEEPTIACCMSGCANCVWLDYAEKLNDYFKDGGRRAVEEINKKVTDPNIKAFLLHELRMRNYKN